MHFEYLFGLRINGGSFNSIFRKIIELVEKKESGYICFVNVHMTVEALRSQNFKKVLLGSDLNCFDGVPLLIANKAINNIKSTNQRVSGMDMLPVLVKYAENKNKSVLFYGSTVEVLESLKGFLNIKYPKLKKVNYYSPPFRELTSNEKKSIVGMINTLNPDFIFVSLGCPKQEKWMFDMKVEINSTMFGVGNAFKTICGLEKRAPKWMRTSGLEWAYRLILEPNRLWKRYLLTNSLFLFYFLRELVWQRLLHRGPFV